MNFPKNRLKRITSHEGRVSDKGWLVLDVKGMDLDGVNAIVIPMEDIETMGQGKETSSNPFDQMKKLLEG